jgi:hypothetical protein
LIKQKKSTWRNYTYIVVVYLVTTTATTTVAVFWYHLIECVSIRSCKCGLHLDEHVRQRRELRK